jgi:solute carrier family 39 (zinc transporter), member 1/2/3
MTNIIRHCVPVGGTEVTRDCEARQRDFNIGLRVGTLFVILVTSCCGVFAPLLLVKLPFVQMNGIVFTIIKQFGTGVIISTAFVHVSNSSLCWSS